MSLNISVQNGKTKTKNLRVKPLIYKKLKNVVLKDQELTGGHSHYTYTRMPPISKSEPNRALQLHKQIETILDLIEAL